MEEKDDNTFGNERGARNEAGNRENVHRGTSGEGGGDYNKRMSLRLLKEYLEGRKIA